MKNILAILSAFIIAGLTGQAQTVSSSAYTGTKEISADNFRDSILTRDTILIRDSVLTKYDAWCYRSDNELVHISQREVPLSVRNAFSIDFRYAKKVKWRLDLNAYAVDFKNENKENVSAYYNSKGQLLEFIILKKKKTLEDPVVNNIKSQFPHSKVKEIMEVKRSDKNKIYYVANIKKERRISQQFFDEEGAIMNY
jgi:hypothetical protein